MSAPTTDSVFLWDAETKVLGKVLPSWDQGQVGCCVSFGWGRGVQDLLLLQVANGAAEEWPGHQVATEEIYGGSRVQIGHNQLGREDGSTGAWAGQFVHEYGVLLRQSYAGGINLSTYSESLTRQWSNSGVPAGLLPECRKHAVRGIAQIGNSDEAWAALGNGYPIPICSDVGFASPLKDGFCAQSGSWGHCMLLRGRFMHPTHGKCFVIQNSWGNYLKPGPGGDQIDTTDRGKVQLPQGCFATTAAIIDRIVKEGDSFAVSSFEGFPNQKVDWLILHRGDLVSRDAEALRSMVWLAATRRLCAAERCGAITDRLANRSATERDLVSRDAEALRSGALRSHY